MANTVVAKVWQGYKEVKQIIEELFVGNVTISSLIFKRISENADGTCNSNDATITDEERQVRRLYWILAMIACF